jgi:uncharacterized protein
MALTSGELDPVSDLQVEFIKVVKREKKPISPFQWAWFKYLGRKRFEVEEGDNLKIHTRQKRIAFLTERRLSNKKV